MSQTLTNEQIARCISVVCDLAAEHGDLSCDSAVVLGDELVYETRTEAAVAGTLGTSTRIERVYFRDLEQASIGITEFETYAGGYRGARTTKFTLEGHFEQLDECSTRLLLFLAGRGCQI